MKKARSILLAAFLLVTGSVLALNVLSFTRVDIFFDGWWTLFIIVPCLLDILTRQKNGAAAGIIIGLALLLSAQNII